MTPFDSIKASCERIAAWPKEEEKSGLILSAKNTVQDWFECGQISAQQRAELFLILSQSADENC